MLALARGHCIVGSEGPAVSQKIECVSEGLCWRVIAFAPRIRLENYYFYIQVAPAFATLSHGRTVGELGISWHEKGS